MEFLYILITSPENSIISCQKQNFLKKLLDLICDITSKLNLKLVLEEFEWGNESIYSNLKIASIEKIISYNSTLFINFVFPSIGIYPDFNSKCSPSPWISTVLKKAHCPGHDKCYFLNCSNASSNLDHDSLSKITFNGRICIDQTVESKTDEFGDIKPELHQWIIRHISQNHPDAFLLADRSVSGVTNRQLAYFSNRSCESLVDPILTRDIWKWCEHSIGKVQVYLTGHDTPLRKVVEDSCLMAASILHKQNPRALVITHKVSLDPDSSKIKQFLTRIMRTLNHKIDLEDLPLTIDQLASYVAHYLEGNFRYHDHLHLIVTGADQFCGDKYAAQMMNWIPKTLSMKVNIFLVMSADSHQYKSLSSRNNPPIVRASLDLPDRINGETEESDLTSDLSADKLSFCTDIQQSKMNIRRKLQDVINNLWLTSLPHDYIRRVPLTVLALLATTTRACLQRNELLCLINRISSIPEDPFGDSRRDEEDCCEPGVVTVNECGDGDYAVEKDQFECSEKSTKLHNSLSLLSKSSDSTDTHPAITETDLSDWLEELERAAVIQECRVPETGISWISLQMDDGIVNVKEVIDNSNWMQPYKEKNRFWTMQLISFFTECVSSIDRKMEELPTLLSRVDDSDLMVKFLSDYRVIRYLYSPHSISLDLLKLWRVSLGHETDYEELRLQYRSLASDQLEIIYGKQADTFQAKRTILMLARILIQAGHFTEAKELARSLLKTFTWSETLDEYEASSHDDMEVLSELYFLLFEIMDERLKICDFIRPQHNNVLKRALLYGSRALKMSDERLSFYPLHLRMSKSSSNPVSAEYRKCLRQHRVAIYLMRLAFALDGWEHCCVCRLYDPDTIRQAAQTMLNNSMMTFKQLKDRQLLAEGRMTCGVIQPRRRCFKKAKMYKRPLEEARLLYGEQHVLIFRLYINIGICYEEANQFIKAFRYFSRWSQCTELLLGANHPKTKRTYGVFQEPRFRNVSSFLRSLNGQHVTGSMENVFNHSLSSASDSELGANDSLSLENVVAATEELSEELAFSDDESPAFLTPFCAVINLYLSKSVGATLDMTSSDSETTNPLTDSDEEASILSFL